MYSYIIIYSELFDISYECNKRWAVATTTYILTTNETTHTGKTNSNNDFVKVTINSYVK